jgi:hypothetical protein
LLIIAVALLAGGTARAQSCPATPPLCNDTTAQCPLTGGGMAACITNPVYVNAADTQVPSLHKLGKLLQAQMVSGAPSPTTIIYVPNGSCTNLANLYATPPKFTTGTAGGPFFVPPDPGFDVTQKTACACQLPTPNTIQPDMAITIVFPDNVSCPTIPATPPTGITAFVGPVQGMAFVVPFDSTTNVGSSQKAITMEEAYLVLGLGPTAAMVTPWSDPNYIYGRPVTKGTQISIGANIQVPAAKWKLLNDVNHMIDQSSTMATTIAGLTADPNAEKVLGILGTEIYDKNRSKIHALAFRAQKQLHAYWPDKTAASFDKQNVRDGHYTLWSYVQYLAPTTAGMAKASVQQIIDSLTGHLTSLTSGTTTSDPIDVVISSGLVPACAMKVQRMSEGGDLSLYSAPEPCGCYFDFKATGSTTCTACSSSSPCATGTCRHGYCEAK